MLASGVFGLVGAGGIGMVLVATFVVVIAAEVLVTQARKRIL